jgi:hypothetical protein
MNLQRISEFAEIQEGERNFLLLVRTEAPRFAQGWGITSGSFHLDRLCEPHHFQ